jgi:hypothetical protein
MRRSIVLIFSLLLVFPDSIISLTCANNGHKRKQAIYVCFFKN